MLKNFFEFQIVLSVLINTAQNLRNTNTLLSKIILLFNSEIDT